MLTASERQSPLWSKIREYYDGRLHNLRAQNDGPLDESKTADLRGRIAEIKALLEAERSALEQEQHTLRGGIPVR